MSDQVRRPDRYAATRVWVALAVLVAALIAAIAWATWEGLRADRSEAQAVAVRAAEAPQGRFALGLALALAAGLAGATLARWARGAGGTPVNAAEPHSDQATLHAVLVGTTEAMILADPQCQIRRVNPAAEILFGYLGEDLAGSEITALFPGLCDEQVSAAVRAQIAAAGNPAMAPVVRESEARRADGQRFPARLWVRGLPLDGEQYLLITVQDITDQDQQGQEIAFLRSHDQLTGLLNRQEFLARLAAVSSLPPPKPPVPWDTPAAPAHTASLGRNARPSGGRAAPGATDVAARAPLPQAADGRVPCVLCHLDLDQFALVNITCGPRAGDKLLQQVARLIEAQLGPADLVARLGGDEYAILLRSGGVDAAIDLCEGLMQTVRGFLFTWQDRSFDIAMSIGISPWDPVTEAADDAMGRADTACHLAKRNGRNRIHVYREGEAAVIRLRGDMHLVSTITQALSAGGFNLFAQPIVPLAGDPDAECHFEILVRMVDGTGALVVPSRFIPAAEHYILMPMVDRWIITRLFALQAENLRAWHQANPDQFLFAVNLSGTTITDDGFLRYLKRQFEDWQIPYPSICFEITETAAVGSLEHARTFIQELSALGCRFALDDFGTGLSSYAYLRAFGVHYLKIDGTFVRGVADDEVNRAMVESINHVGHILGLKTIAEWAEDERTLAVLRALQVDYAQGFAVGAAVPVEEFTLAHATRAGRLEHLGNS